MVFGYNLEFEFLRQNLKKVPLGPSGLGDVKKQSIDERKI